MVSFKLATLLAATAFTLGALSMPVLNSRTPAPSGDLTGTKSNSGLDVPLTRGRKGKGSKGKTPESLESTEESELGLGSESTEFASTDSLEEEGGDLESGPSSKGAKPKTSKGIDGAMVEDPESGLPRSKGLGSKGSRLAGPKGKKKLPPVDPSEGELEADI